MRRFVVGFVASLVVPAVFSVGLFVLLNRIHFPLAVKLAAPAFLSFILVGRGRVNAKSYLHEFEEGETTRSGTGFLISYSTPFLAAPPLGILADYIDWNYGFFIPTVSALTTSTVAFMIGLARSHGSLSLPRWIALRGRVIITYEKARKIAQSLGYGSVGLQFAGLTIPFSKALLHFLIVGASGSGKTITIRKLLIDICRFMQNSKACQAVIFDAKLDVIPAIQEFSGKQLPILDLHPFRSGCYAWNIAEDIRTSRDAELAALTLFPQQQGNSSDQEFFREGPRTLMEELVRALQVVAPRNWTLRDVYILMTTPRLCRQMLQKLPDAKTQIEDLLEDFFDGDPRTTANLRVSIRARFRRFKHIAAAWHSAHSAGRSVSLKEWAKSGKGFLVLGADKLDDSAVNAVNRLVMTVLGKHWLEDRASYAEPKHFLILDEVQSAGEFDLLHKLLTEGREKGVSAILGFQDIGSMHRVYGKENAGAILGQCGMKAFLRIEGEQTAEWASKMIGDVEQLEFTYGKSSSYSPQQGESQSWSRNEQIVRKAAVMPSQFMTLPVTNQKNGLSGYYGVNEIGVWRHTMSASEFPPRVGNSEDDTDADDSEDADVQLKSFDAADYQRLQLVDPDMAQASPMFDEKQAQPKKLKSVRKLNLTNDDE